MKILNKLQTVLLALFIINSYVQAQEIEVIADYPLIENLTDQTGINGEVILQGNPLAPLPPSAGIELCSNNIYLSNVDGQDIQTPYLQNFDLSNFQVELDFKITEFPDALSVRPRNPIIMGGWLARWLGIYVDSSGILGIKHNNSNYSWSTTSINQVDTWYSARLRYSNETADLYLDDQLIFTENVGPLTDWESDHNFTITDFSEGNPANGCIRNLVISSTPDIIYENSFE